MYLLTTILLGVTFSSFGVSEDTVSTLVKEYDIHRLLNHVYEENHHKDLNDLASSFKFEDNWDQWTDSQYAKEFYDYFKNGISRDKIFSLYDDEQLKQVVALFKTLFYAKDYKTFLKIAAWARNNLNPDMFSYVLCVAVINTNHCTGIYLPAFYEISPYYYYSEATIRTAQQYKKDTKDSQKELIVETNFTEVSRESIAYFTQDVGVNSNYFINHLMLPFWIEEKELISVQARGEYFYFYHKNLLARYNLERYSNGMDIVSIIDMDDPIEEGYSPSMIYPNGVSFPTRASNISISACDDANSTNIEKLKESIKHVREFVEDGGWIVDKDQVMRNTTNQEMYINLINIVMGSAQSPNVEYYGRCLRNMKKLLGCSLDKGVPATLENFQTTLRDPVIWPIHKDVMNLYHNFWERVGSQELKKLSFPGVKIENVEISELVTYFEHFYSDLGNAVSHTKEEIVKGPVEITARQLRLNHKPFNYTIKVSSENATEAFVKIFLGPKHTFTPDDGRHYVELDRFHQNLVEGENVIHRSSTDSKFYADDKSMFRKSCKVLKNQVEMNKTHDAGDWVKYSWFPRRLILPKGTIDGQAYQIFVTVNRFYHNATPIELMVDHFYEFNFPFERSVESVSEFHVPNFRFSNVVIRHREDLVDTPRS